MYWAVQNSDYDNFDTQFALKNNSIEKNDYLLYVRWINQCYADTSRWLGVIGPRLASAINVYNKYHNIDYRASWRISLSNSEMLKKINEMLDKDIPVIFSVGPNTPNIFGDAEIGLYGKKINKGEVQYTQVSSVNDHYMTITGIINDKIAGKTMLCVSSWGEKFYIDYNEYRNYIDTYGDNNTSSMIYIK